MRFDEELLRLEISPITYVDGKPQSQVITKHPFQANVQPLSGRDLLIVPEHQRFLEQWWIFVPLHHALTAGNIIHRKGIHYQIQETQSWGSFQECRMMRVDVGVEQTP
jgi:hypothetical protein